MIVYHPDGRRAIGRAQGTRGGYPLDAPSADVADLLAEVYLNAPAELLGDPPLRIATLYGFGEGAPTAAVTATHTADVAIVDGLGQTVVDTAAAGFTYRTADYAGRLRIHEWRSDSVFLRIVQHTHWPTGDARYTPREYPSAFAPTSAILGVDAVEPRLTPTPYDGFPGATSLVFEFDGGLSAAAVTGGARVAADALVSRGSGCGEAPYLAKLGEATPGDSGGLWISGGNPCHIAGPALQAYTDPFTGVVSYGLDLELSRVPLPGKTVRIANDCTPCMTCDDVVSLKQAIDDAYWRLVNAGTLLESIRGGYDHWNAVWADAKACADAKPLRIFATAACDGIIALECRYRMPPEEGSCRGPVTLTLTADAGLSVIPGSLLTTNPPSTTVLAPASPQPAALPVVVTWTKLTPATPGRLRAVLRLDDPTVTTVVLSAVCELGGSTVATADLTVTNPGPC